MTATIAPAARASRLIQRVESLRRTRPERALRALARDFAAAARGADPATRGGLWRLRGHVLRGLRRARPAAAAYRAAERWYAAAGDRREQGRCAIGLVDALMYLARYGEAERAARRGRRLLRRAGDRVSLARLLNNEGNLFHRLDLPGRALACYRDATRGLRRAGDTRGAALVEINVANCLALLGQPAPARRHYLSARRAGAAAGFELDALNAEYNLAYLDFLEHRHEAALDALAAVRRAARDHGYPSLAALATLDRAEILLRMGVHPEALEEAGRAVEATGALGLRYERAKAETFAALAEFRLGQSAAARQRLERTLGIFHAEGNSVWMGEALVGLATVWEREGNPRAAAALLGAARFHFARARDREREGCALALRARARLRCGQPRAAEASLAALRRLGGTRHASPRLRHLSLAAEAAAARGRGDLARARTWLRRAARESERLAARILDEQWRSTFWGEWGWPHRELAALELEHGRVAEALEALEAGRGRALVGQARARRAAGGPLPPGVRAWAVGRLAREREHNARSVPAAPTAAPAHAEAAAGHPPKVGPGLRRVLEARPPRSIRAAALRRLLPPRTLLVDYLLHEGALSAIAVRRGGLAGHPRLAAEGMLGQLAHALLFALRSAAFAPPAARPGDPRLDEQLHELASLVLWPLLAGRETPASLAVAPVGPLTRLPWAALPLPDGRALCEAMELAVVPGLRLGLARPRPGAHRSRVGVPASGPLVIASDAGELENVGPETRAVLGAFPGARLLAGDQATAARFLELAPGAPWIHFAGHGVHRPDAPQESGLRFADRWLLAGELADLRLNARWVTLSACQTARALVHPGEEWFGLARSLLLAGARAVVAPQWDLEDAAAAVLMADLYRRLAAGESLGASLAGAQSARRRAGVHPLEWAGFVALTGPGPAPPATPEGTGSRNFETPDPVGRI
ncbi:MAG: CHAT domain-containing protein [Candidatus Eisenbacteria bacterium]|nr:CHAT domain-containing protein [Candidatus Eisenbacteria bacterium]